MTKASLQPFSAGSRRYIALRFVVLIGILSFLPISPTKGRSILGPYLATLQASGTIVDVVTARSY